MMKEELLEHYEKVKTMSEAELREALLANISDSVYMEERVEKFMEICTDDRFSYTTYTPEVIEWMVYEKRKMIISEFCKDVIEEDESGDRTIYELLQSFIIK